MSNKNESTTIRKKEWRRKNPMKYAFNTLRNNAKRRGKEFTITFEYFKEFCFITKHMENKGIHRSGYGVDRIDPTKGYIPGNIRSIPNHINVSRHVRAVVDPDQRKIQFVTETNIEDPNQFDDVPF